MKKTIIIICGVIALLTAWIGHRTEIDFGRVTNNQGDGKLYNGEPYYNYCYYDTARFHENDIVLTVCILNPLNNYCDDIVIRLDKCVFRNI